MTTPKLKPCPFCGGKAVIERKGTSRQSMVITCEDCGCRHECGDVYGLTRNLAWNLRAPCVEIHADPEPEEPEAFWGGSEPTKG